MFIIRYRPMGGGGGGSVILVRNNLSIPPVEHNFEHNNRVSRVTPESTILCFFFYHNPANPNTTRARRVA